MGCHSFLWAKSILLCKCTAFSLSIHPPRGICVNSVLFTCVNQAAVNVGVHVFLWSRDFIVYGCIPRSRSAGLHGCFSFGLWRTLCGVFAHYAPSSQGCVKGPTLLPTFIFVSLKVRVVSDCGFCCLQFYDDGWTWAFLATTCVSFSEKRFVPSGVSLFSFLNSFHVLDASAVLETGSPTFSPIL